MEVDPLPPPLWPQPIRLALQSFAEDRVAKTDLVRVVMRLPTAVKCVSAKNCMCATPPDPSPAVTPTPASVDTSRVEKRVGPRAIF